MRTGRLEVPSTASQPQRRRRIRGRGCALPRYTCGMAMARGACAKRADYNGVRRRRHCSARAQSMIYEKCIKRKYSPAHNRPAGWSLATGQSPLPLAEATQRGRPKGKRKRRRRAQRGMDRDSDAYAGRRYDFVKSPRPERTPSPTPTALYTHTALLALKNYILY